MTVNVNDPHAVFDQAIKTILDRNETSMREIGDRAVQVALDTCILVLLRMSEINAANIIRHLKDNYQPITPAPPSNVVPLRPSLTKDQP